ncbi:MAG: secondary thiamine-phosphate synthase enzyme YjbQ [Synergistales bacterium]|nr:secondary thiamine-phosphate synthase enzyme YjbQ [Synergistales bacterium]
MTEQFSVATSEREVFVEITREVQEAVTASGVGEGVCHVYVPHTTAAVTVNERADPDVPEDILGMLHTLVPHKAGYRHIEGNADAHIKATLVGVSETIPVSGGRLALGRWQGVFFCEFDGPRRRQVAVTVTA